MKQMGTNCVKTDSMSLFSDVQIKTKRNTEHSSLSNHNDFS